MTSDVDMAELENDGMIETPHGKMTSNGRFSRVSYESSDSGYLTLTPHSTSGVTSTMGSMGCRSRNCLATSKKHYRMRNEPWQSDRTTRLRSKLNLLINASDVGCDSFVDDTGETGTSGISRDSGIFSCERRTSMEECSIGNGDVGILETKDLGAAMRERRGRTRRSCKSGVPATPASRLELLSPPLSPAVPSSSFVASEPIDEDVKMKLVVPQSTPYPTTGDVPRFGERLEDESLSYSPTTRRRSPQETVWTDDGRLSKLAIAEAPAPVLEIKPKRLDFSQRALSYARHRTRATPDCTGIDKIDVMSLLGEKSNHWRVVSKILSHLSSQDLCSISMVSKAWRRICNNDSRANMRRLSHVILRRNAKENLKMIKKSKTEAEVQGSPRSRYARMGYLIEVQNLLQVPGPQRPPNSPPVSPSKVKFHSFVKASRTLEPWEHLLRCPNCSFPCHVDGEKNVGKCSRQGCGMEFCTSCSSRPHSGPCKTPLLATPTKRNKRLIVGSRQSKRNLRRL